MRSLLLVLFLNLYTILVFAHGDKPHKVTESKENTVVVESTGSANQEINDNYLKYVKPIFQMKCMDCHGSGNEKPWYYALPGSKQLMDSDIEEAKEHMDMTNDFPFGGHGEPGEDLESLEESIKEETMPPWQYKLMHWSSTLTEPEKDTIKKWIKESLILIKQEEPH